jgi:hypothetical protein
MESVRSREHKLRVVQGEFPRVRAGIARGGFCNGVWFACTNCAEQFFRLTFELTEIRALRERSGGEILLHK